MPYIRFSQTTAGETVVWTIRLEDLGWWSVSKALEDGPLDSEGGRTQIDVPGRVAVSFADPLGSGRPITLTPDQSDAFLRVLESLDVHDLDSPAV